MQIKQNSQLKIISQWYVYRYNVEAVYSISLGYALFFSFFQERQRRAYANVRYVIRMKFHVQAT
jgi:hypothetical protein